MIPVTLAVEDDIAEALVFRVILQTGARLRVDQVLQKRGIGHLRTKAESLNRAANGGIKSILLIDSDAESCPVRLANSWFPHGRSADLMFRAAVREAESWILADAEGLSAFLAIPEGRVPQNPDDVADSKQALVDLARRSPRKVIREALVPSPGKVVPVGVGYNPTITEFVRTNWKFSRAVSRSPSLESFGRRLQRLAGV